MTLRTHADIYIRYNAVLLRAEAVRWDRVAAKAAEEGDTHHEEVAKNNAANCRRRAREIEVYEEQT